MWCFIRSSSSQLTKITAPRGRLLRRQERRLLGTKYNQSSSISVQRILLRPALFTGAVCFGSFGAVAIWRYEQHDHKKKNKSWLTSAAASIWGDRQEQNTYSYWRIPSRLKAYLPRDLVSSIESTINDNRVTTVGPIIAANMVVFCALHLRFPGYLLSRHFVHKPDSGQALPLLLSSFAHIHPVHLGINMYVLWDFGDHLVQLFGGKQEFWAAYVSAGTVSSFLSTCLDLMMKLVLRRSMGGGGLGASGALYGVLVAFFLEHPDAPVGIIGLPYQFSALELSQYLVTFDMVGFLLGWRVLGHSAHLGGAAAGYYAMEMDGLKHISKYQDFVVRSYKELKEGSVSG